MEKPSKTGTACVTPSPESRTKPVVRPEEYLSVLAGVRQIQEATHRLNTACTLVKKAGTLNVSKNT